MAKSTATKIHWTKQTLYDLLYGYQTRLQGVANDLAVRIAALIGTTDESVLKLLRGAVKKENLPLDKELERLAKIISKIEAARKPAYKAAKKLLFDTSASVAKAATDQTAKEFNLQLRMARQKAREERFCKTLSKDQLDAILSGQGIEGATIEDWFDRWRRGDLEKLAGLVRKASVESLTVADITRAARGSITSKAPEYHSLLLYPKVDAARMARTIINGVSNNARAETIQANSDVIDGVRFVGTLDGKTCPYCAAYDGYIWRGEDMASARRPPIHPNCRCTLVPVVDLKDEDGNPIELVDEEGKSVEERPAANADFDQLAKDAYNAQAKAKGWNRRWDDLAASTRLKYYYQAQKDYEAKTGKPAYRQVPSSMTFKEYFDKQDDAFKKAWLGAKAFEEYKSGDLSEATREKLLFKPNLSYQVKPETLIGWQKGYDETEALIEEIEKAAEKDGVEAQEARKSGYSFDEEEEKYRKIAFDREFESNPDSKNLKVIERYIPKDSFGGKNSTYKRNAEIGAREGLACVARICDKYGLDLSQIGDFRFETELLRRAKYNPSSNTANIGKRRTTIGKYGTTSDVAHELGHALEEKLFGGYLKVELEKFLDEITIIDDNGSVEYIEGRIDEGHRFRKTSITLPDTYAAKEYIDERTGKLDGTELLSIFFQTLYEKPRSAKEESLKPFFEGMEKCFINAAKEERRHNGNRQ